MIRWYALLVFAIFTAGFFSACGNSLEDELEECQERCDRINEDRSNGTVCLGCFPTTAQFSASPNETRADLEHMVVEEEADLDGDGLLDLIIASRTEEVVSVLLGRDSDGLQTWRHFATAQRPEAMSITDIDGDGILDLVISSSDSEKASVLFGHGDGNFGPGQYWVKGQIKAHSP